jgi:hypothetical protein
MPDCEDRSFVAIPWSEQIWLVPAEQRQDLVVATQAQSCSDRASIHHSMGQTSALYQPLGDIETEHVLIWEEATSLGDRFVDELGQCHSVKP